MANYALLSAIGKDKPGIVAAVSNVLYQTGCNIEDSTMARLGGDFVIMLMLQLPEGTTAQQLAEQMGDVRRKTQLTLDVSDLRPEEVERQPESPKHLILVYGSDAPGIVAKVTSILADRNININNLRTNVVHRDTPLYVMTIEVEIPPFVNQGELQKQFQTVASEIGVQVELKPKPDARF